MEDGASEGTSIVQKTSSLGLTSDLKQISSPPSVSVVCCVKSQGDVVAADFP